MTPPKTIRTIFFSFVIAIGLFIPFGLATAQETSSLTLSEATINDALSEGVQDPNTDLSVDLQAGQLVINLAVTGQDGNTTRFGLTLVPYFTASGDLDFEATELTINDFALNIDNNNRAVTDTAGSVNNFLNEQAGGGQIENIVITDSSITLEWRNANITDPSITIQDALVNVTFTESQINQMDWVTNPTGANVTGIRVDLQPGQAVISATQSVQPTSVAYVVIPRVVNNRVAWQIDAQANTQGSLATSLATIWRAYFNGIYGDAGMVNAVITDNSVTFTWGLANLAGAEPENPVVTYTLNESEVNAALAAFTTTELSSLLVDMQPGRIVINASGVDDSNAPYSAALALVPNLRNGTLNWLPESITFNGLVLDASVLQSGNQATAALTQGLDGNQGDAVVTDVQIDDTKLSVTVRYP